jgi:hypothetical protein
MQPRYAVRPTKDEELSEAGARWYKLTGEELGEDVYILGTTFTRQVVLPRQTLLSIYQALENIRAEFPEPPFPWLFRAEPYHLTPTNGEEEVVRELSERAVAFKEFLGQEQASRLAFNDSFTKLVHDLEEAGLFSDIYSEEKQYWLERWELPTLLVIHRAGLAFFNHFRQKRPALLNYVTQKKSEQVPKEASEAKPSKALGAQHAHLGLSSYAG